MATRKAVLTTLDRTASKIHRLIADVKAIKPHETIASKARLVRMEAEDLGKAAGAGRMRQCNHCAANFDETTTEGAAHLASCRIYQGWANYETWAVALWIDNDEGMSDTVREWAAEAREAATQDKSLASIPEDRRAGYALSRRLKAEFHDGDAEAFGPPDLGASLWADLLGAALSEVNWREIANAKLSD